MSDNLTRRQRSALMARINGDRLKPEQALESALVAGGARVSFLRNCKGLPGTPDFVVWATGSEFAKVAVFVDGCFWHGCPKHYREPRTRPLFWREHIGGNVRRDRRQRRALRKLGYRVLRVWEHDLKRAGGPAAAAARVRKMLYF